MYTQKTAVPLFIVLAIALSGCSSIRSRSDMPPEKWTVFPGVQQDGSDMIGTLSGQVQPLWTSALVGPVLLADVPFSLVTDTLALPYDLYTMGNNGTAPAVKTSSTSH